MFAMWSAVVCGVIIFALAFSRTLSPGLILDIGLVFEVVVAFFIGLMQASRYPADLLVHTGIAGITIWVAVFVLVVPASTGKTALAALASALMGPVAVIVASYLNGQPSPPPYLFFVITFPSLVAGAVAIILARFVYNLGRDTSNAQEMGSYKLIELLGRGGMGEVWRAQHRFLARPAAIKLIQPEVLGCTQSKEVAAVKRRFEREAQATAMLSSVHTINLYDFGQTEDGAFYYVMELLRGVDLQTLVERYGPVPADRASHLLIQACSSLEEAHRAGLVHRDIKPANIYSCRYGLEYDFVKVLDFGIVKAKGDPVLLTGETSVESATGTPGFMAPELALGAKEIDGRVDIYGLGCVAYWLLTGRLVFEEETFIATLLAHAQKRPVPPSQRTEILIPPTLEELIMACLEKDPAKRPATAAEVARIMSESEADSTWTSERAEKWWVMHMPEKSAVALQSDTTEHPLQSNVAAS
jgi:serine/threonine-protein kinase